MILLSGIGIKDIDMLRELIESGNIDVLKALLNLQDGMKNNNAIKSKITHD